MTTNSLQDPFEATAKAVDALLSAMERTHTAGALAAYRAAITRHGRNILDAVGPEGMAGVLVTIRKEAPDKCAAETRERAVLQAWEGLEA